MRESDQLFIYGHWYVSIKHNQAVASSIFHCKAEVCTILNVYFNQTNAVHVAFITEVLNYIQIMNYSMNPKFL